METWEFLFEIVLLLGAALLLGIVMERLKQNVLIGYLLTGILIGPSGLGLVEAGEQVSALAELGVALLLFTIGLEFSWRRLREFGATAAVGGAGQILITLLLTMGVALALGRQMGEALAIGAAVSLSSTAIVLRVLGARAELDSVHGRNSLGILLLQDIAVVPLLLLIAAFAQGLDGWSAARDFGLRAGQGVALVVALWLLNRWVLARLSRSASASGNRDLPILLAITVALGGAWASHGLGLSPALGAFVCGMLLAESPFADQIRADVVPLRAGFVTVFFASVGMLARLPGVEALGLDLALAAGVIVGKALVVTALLVVLRQPVRAAVGTGLALAQIGEFSFVLMGSASRGGLIPESSFQAMLAASLLTLFATPYLIALAPRVMQWAGATAATETGPGAREPRVIIVGFGPAGQAVATALEQAAIPYLALELNPRTAEQFRSRVPVSLGDATQVEILEHAGVATARALVVTIPDPHTSRVIIRQSRRLAPNVPIIVRARHHVLAHTLAEAGADRMVDEEQSVGTLLGAETLEVLKAQADA